MVVITEHAKKHLKEALLAKTHNPDVGFRLVRKSETGKFVLKFDKEREHDQVVLHQDSKVLLIDEVMSARPGILTIDFGGRGPYPQLIIVAR